MIIFDPGFFKITLKGIAISLGFCVIPLLDKTIPLMIQIVVMVVAIVVTLLVVIILLEIIREQIAHNNLSRSISDLLSGKRDYLYEKLDSEIAKQVLAAQISKYTQWVTQNKTICPTSNMNDQASAYVSWEMDDIYIDLQLEYENPPKALLKSRPHNKKIAQRVNLDYLIGYGKRIIIDGKPGSGKTTLLNHILLDLCRQSREISSLNGDTNGNSVAPFIPFCFTLTDYAIHLSTIFNRLGKPENRTLDNYIVKIINLQIGNILLGKDFFKYLISQNHRVILLLDRLDEIGNIDLQKQVCNQIDEFTSKYPNIQIIITTRFPFKHSRLPRPKQSYQHVRLAALRRDDVLKLLRRIPCRTRKHQFVELIKRGFPEDCRGDLRVYPLVNIDTPLASRALALIVLENHSVLEKESAFLGEFIRALIYMEGKLDLPDGGLPIQDNQGYLEILEFLAYKMHRLGRRLFKEVDEIQLRALVNEDTKFRNSLNDFIKHCRCHGYIFQENNGQYCFCNEIIHNYLVASYLSKNKKPKCVADLLINESSLDDDCKKVILFYREMIKSQFAEFIECLAGITRSIEGEDYSLLCARFAVHVCNRVFFDNKPDIRERLRTSLQEAFRSNHIASLDDRNNALGSLPLVEDNRFQPNLGYLPSDNLCGFVFIPSGGFRMGEGRGVHWVDLPDYFIARYPVTIAQYKSYLNKDTNPCEFDNTPVVGVSWFDALHYCEWLQERIANLWFGMLPELANLLNNGWEITLPSEAQWEKAARCVNSYVNPWANNAVLNNANTLESGIGRTSVVGLFPRNDYGLFDMIGNVEEWTRSIADRYPYPPPGLLRDRREVIDNRAGTARVFRGGAWNTPSIEARCATRTFARPESTAGNLGFRLCLRRRL